MTSFGNARLDQRGEISVEDLPKANAGKGKLGFLQ
jgi:ATP-dependent Lon protease